MYRKRERERKRGKVEEKRRTGRLMKKSKSCPALSSRQNTQIVQSNIKSVTHVKKSCSIPNIVPNAIDSDQIMPFFYNAAFNTATCFAQNDSVKDIAFCVATPPDIVESDTITRNDYNLSRFEEFYRIFKRRREKRRKEENST